MKTLVVALLVVVPAVAAQSKRAAEEEPLEVLLRAQQVDDEAVGTAGSRSERYAAFVELWKEGSPGVRASTRSSRRERLPAGSTVSFCSRRSTLGGGSRRRGDEGVGR